MASISEFGQHDGAPVRLVKLRLGAMEVSVSTYGATLTSIRVPDHRGEPVETILGFGELGAYERCPFYLGCTVGRFANRIRGGAFPLDDGTGKERTVQLAAANDRGNTLHGGARGWDKHVWALADASATSCTLAHASPDGDEGFPGAVEATVTFSLEWGGRLAIRYRAAVRGPAPTVLSLTNHAYFNLSDGGATDMLDHELLVFADHYLPTDANCLPTGEVKAVAGPMDLRAPTPVCRGISQADGGGGYDHNFVVRTQPADSAGLRRAAWLRSPRTGIELSVLTTEPGARARVRVGSRAERALASGRPGGDCARVRHQPYSHALIANPAPYPAGPPAARRHSGLWRQPPRRPARQQRRAGLREPGGHLPGDAAVPGRAQPSGVALVHRVARQAARLDDGLCVQRERQRDAALSHR